MQHKKTTLSAKKQSGFSFTHLRWSAVSPNYHVLQTHHFLKCTSD